MEKIVIKNQEVAMKEKIQKIRMIQEKVIKPLNDSLIMLLFVVAVVVISMVSRV